MAPRTTYDWLRDYVGYGQNPPDPQWPGGARIALNFNLNYETGGEANILDGDPASEGMLNDIGFPPVPGQRNPMVESAFEYGSRVGVWRVLRIFARSMAAFAPSRRLAVLVIKPSLRRPLKAM